MITAFKLHTYDIQHLMICLIEKRASDSKKKIITEDDYDRLDRLLTYLNSLCTEENSYSLTITVDNGGID